MSLPPTTFLCIKVICENSYSWHHLPPNMWGTEEGPVCSLAVLLTPDITPTSSDKHPPTLTLCIWPKRNSLIHTSTLESTSEDTIFVISQSWGTKLKNLLLLHQSWFPQPGSQQGPGKLWLFDFCMSIHVLNHVGPHITTHCYPRLVLGTLQMIRSICLQTTEVKLTGL